jgi:hypothetical protein
MPRFGVPTCVRTVEPEFFPQSLPRYRALASHLFPSASPRPQVGSLFEFFEEFDILKRHHGGKRSIPSRKQNAVLSEGDAVDHLGETSARLSRTHLEILACPFTRH